MDIYTDTKDPSEYENKNVSTNTGDYLEAEPDSVELQESNLYETTDASNPNVITKVNTVSDDDLVNINDEDNYDSEYFNIHKLDLENENYDLCKPNTCDPIETADQDLEMVKGNNGMTKTESVKFNNVKCSMARDRKLSLDHTILSKPEGLSQSEMNLNWVGKKSLERKQSFFKKKMDIFLRNTTEIFRKRSTSKSDSLQSLNCKNLRSDDSVESFDPADFNQEYGRNGACAMPPPIVRSVSSLSVCQSGRYATQPYVPSYAGSQPGLHALSTSTLEDDHSNSVHSLNESFLSEQIWKSRITSRAISMNSGLDTPTYQQKKYTNRANRVTWTASEFMANYFLRLDQDESKKKSQSHHPQQDFSRTSENEINRRRLDTKGRRLSYQRAVSGEDPAKSIRGQDSTMRRRNRIPESHENHDELANLLAEYDRTIIPELPGFSLLRATDEDITYVLWSGSEYFKNACRAVKLSKVERTRHAIIEELVVTESDYIKHLVHILEVYMATAHAVQDKGKMLAIDTEKLFFNLPDLLNSSFDFWHVAFVPMIRDAMATRHGFNISLMIPGFSRFAELLEPYAAYVERQSQTLRYLSNMKPDPEFAIYLAWCYSYIPGNRLDLSDFLVKPMQRLTKYQVIIDRIIEHSTNEAEKQALIAMNSHAKTYVQEVNRTIRYREETEKLDDLCSLIECYEVEFKDEEMDRYYKMFSQLNLRTPMLNCSPLQSRCLIHDTDVKFKDGTSKESEVHIFIFTDILLVCKRISRSLNHYKQIRPKYMIDRMLQFQRFVTHKHGKELVALVYVVVDDMGSSYASFTLTESNKEKASSIKFIDTKLREAKYTYDLTVWQARNNPRRELNELEKELALYGLNPGSYFTTETKTVDADARERVMSMIRPLKYQSLDNDSSIISVPTDSFDGASSGRLSYSYRHLVHRTSTASSRNSRLSSFQHSTSGTSHDEPQPGPSRMYLRASTPNEQLSVESTNNTVTSIMVNVVDDDAITAGPSTSRHPAPTTPIVMIRSPGKPPGSKNTLRVQTQNNVQTLIHSLPDLTIEPSTPRTISSPTRPSVSEKMYQSHQELLQRNRLLVAQQHQYLSPDHRGTSYPPPTPNRASLKRGLAFSSSLKNPPLSKMGHVNSESQIQIDASPSLSQRYKLERTKPDKGDKKSNTGSREANEQAGHRNPWTPAA